MLRTGYIVWLESRTGGEKGVIATWMIREKSAHNSGLVSEVQHCSRVLKLQLQLFERAGNSSTRQELPAI
jgi:hypothetical protein